MRKSLLALAAVFLAVHLPFLPPTLEDIDSINFALGVRDFDVARHQPHPPGYPLFVVLGKMSTPMFRAAGVTAPEPRALAFWSVVSAAALVFLVFAFVRALDDSDWRAWWTTVVVAASPLVWFTALRPLSDMTGLAVAMGAQVLAARVVAGRASSRALLAGAFLAGLAIGIRSQTFLLTLPLLGLALALPRHGIRVRDRIAALGTAAAGVLVWGIPLVVASGGLESYLAALGSQAGEDFSGVVMLWTARRARVALDALLFSFLWPWGHLVAGGIVVAVAVFGGVRVLWQRPRVLGVLLAGYLPYAVFHLLFHETATVRYALPLVIPVAYLAVCALDLAGRLAVSGGALALAVWSLTVSVPAAAVYGREGSPAFRALREASDTGVGEAGRQEVVVAVHAVARRAVEWMGPDLRARVLKAPHGREWLALVEQWRASPQSVIAFVADPRRTDLALVDPQSREGPRPYRWGFVEPPFVGGARPGNSDVYVMRPPGWMLDRGWAVTPEVAGITSRERLGPHRAPSIAWIRSRSDGALLMIGGRHLGAAGDPAVRISLALNGRPLETFDAAPGFFVKRLSLPPGALTAPQAYLPMEVKSEPVAGTGRERAVGLEQFDLQGSGVPMVGVEEGWQEPEYNPLTARSWRWMSERATLWVRPLGRDVTLTLAGESPLRYYATSPSVKISAAGRALTSFSPADDFTVEVVIPADVLAAADGHVVLESDKWFVPGERTGADDRRHLALRIYSIAVK